MIEKAYNEYHLICDVCGDEETGFEYWDDAKDARKELGWIVRRDDKGWMDICPMCKDGILKGGTND